MADLATEPVEAEVTWSIMVPTYRPDDLLREAVLSAQESLAQQQGSWQFEIVDDGTPDIDVVDLLAAWGIHNVTVYRRPVNGGLAACWNTCLARAKGRLVHLLHQDDLVRPGFYSRMGQAADRFPEAGMLFCRTEFKEGKGWRLDQMERADEGVLDDWLMKISSGQRLQCPSVVVRRSTYKLLGGYDLDLRYVIDWVMWVRIAARTPVAYVPEPLAIYRIHEGAETGRIKAAGIVTADAVRGIARLSEVLQARGRRDCLRAAASYALWISTRAAWEAEQALHYRVALREVGMALLHLCGFMKPKQVLVQIRWYCRLQWMLLKPNNS